MTISIYLYVNIVRTELSMQEWYVNWVREGYIKLATKQMVTEYWQTRSKLGTYEAP